MPAFGIEVEVCWVETRSVDEGPVLDEFFEARGLAGLSSTAVSLSLALGLEGSRRDPSCVESDAVSEGLVDRLALVLAAVSAVLESELAFSLAADSMPARPAQT